MTTPPRPAAARTGAIWWVRVQHDDVKVVSGRERPNVDRVPGERLAYAIGPYQDEAQARQRAEDIYSRTHKAMLERMGL